MSTLHLYLDDSGSRYSDRELTPPRADGMDYFALGGILVEEEAIGQVYDAHAAFASRWELTAPLHSTKIRGARNAFSWLSAERDAAARFFVDLDELILSSPTVALACVIDRLRIPTKPAGDSDLKPAVVPRRSRPPFRSEAGRWRRRSRGSEVKITGSVQQVKR